MNTATNSPANENIVGVTKKVRTKEVIFNVHASPHTTFSIATLLSISLKRPDDVAPCWEKTIACVLENPEKVLESVFDMLEDIEATGDKEFKTLHPNGIKEYVEKHASTRGYKLEGESYDPEQKKLRVLATCIDRLDKATTRVKEATLFMVNLHKSEPEEASFKTEYMATQLKKMPHWTNPTDDEFLGAVWELNQAANDAREKLEVVGQTTSPDKYPQTIASLFANLSIVQAMDLETKMGH